MINRCMKNGDQKCSFVRALSYVSFSTSRLKEIVSREGALNSRAGTDAQADEGLDKMTLSSVFRVSVKTT